eukprot:TRINITY_DN2810_c0_g2_i1.p1 TRINITY_DN2810_c0_g2~~TRINITY_DN2810_c0_g2_i1.p1  ORF type:complete len:409 (-),score=67.35 TRINITY_DN2810_c0_g2_i1:122-1225(-)
MGSISPFEFPQLRIGTLDSLMSLSDELGKTDNACRNVTGKFARELRALLNEDKDDKAKKKEENFDIRVGSNTLEHYLKTFKWNAKRWDETAPLFELVENINKETGDIESKLKDKLAAWSGLNQKISALKKNETGSLLLRDLSSLVTEEDFFETPADKRDTDLTAFLTTLLVVVPNSLVKTWQTTYETLSRFVLPGSALLIAEDAEHTLYSVKILANDVENFKQKARESRFTPRDFKFQEGGTKAQDEKKKELESKRDSLKTELFNFLSTNISECVEHWMHLKCIRIWVESILRYGPVPPNFVFILVQPNEKGSNERKMRLTLDTMFADLARLYDFGDKEDDATGAGVIGTAESFHPYVQTIVDAKDL